MPNFIFDWTHFFFFYSKYNLQWPSYFCYGFRCESVSGSSIVYAAYSYICFPHFVRIQEQAKIWISIFPEKPLIDSFSYAFLSFLDIECCFGGNTHTIFLELFDEMPFPPFIRWQMTKMPKDDKNWVRNNAHRQFHWFDQFRIAPFGHALKTICQNTEQQITQT